MDGGLIAAVVIAVLGTGGVGAAIAAWRKSIPEVKDIGVGTQERIFSMANDLLDDVRGELKQEREVRKKCQDQLKDHEGRIRELERRLRAHGLPDNGVT